MQHYPDFESDHPQIQRVAVQVPYRRMFWFLAIALALQATAAGVAAYYFGKSSATQIVDVSTLVAIVVFISGSLMWGRFPGVDAPMIEHVDKSSLSIFRDAREMSISNRARGGLLMLSSMVFGLGSVGLHWAFR